MSSGSSSSSAIRENTGVDSNDAPLLLRKVVALPPLDTHRLRTLKFTFQEEFEAANAANPVEVRRSAHGVVDSADRAFAVPVSRIPAVLLAAGFSFSQRVISDVLTVIRENANRGDDGDESDGPRCSFVDFLEWFPSFDFASRVERGVAIPQEESGDGDHAPFPDCSLQARHPDDTPEGSETDRDAASNSGSAVGVDVPGAVKFAKKPRKEPLPVCRNAKRIYEIMKQKLPIDRTPEQVLQRRKLFRQFDMTGNGYLSLALIQRGIRDVLKIDALFDIKPVIMRAYQAARGAGNADCDPDSLGHDYVELNEFRILLVWLLRYFELWVMFSEIDVSGDGRIDEEEFVALGHRIEAWGIPHADDDELRAVFREVDKDGGGKILFVEFCEWGLAKGLDVFADNVE